MSRSVDDVKTVLGEDDELVTFEVVGEYIKVIPRGFLGDENFARIASKIRQMNGEYISAGKKSHFKVPRGNPVNQKDMEVRGAIQLIESGLKKLKEVYK